MHYLTDKQVEILLRPINPARVNRNARGFAHVEAYEIRAHLNRIFGFCRWSADVLNQDLVFEMSHTDSSNPDKPVTRWTVCYRSLLRLTIYAPDGEYWLASYTEGATGEAINQPSRSDAHDLALKNSQSYALKRCAANLGDQFGLGLYNKGSYASLVKGVLVGRANEDTPTGGPAPDAHITEHLADEDQPVEEVRPVPYEESPVDDWDWKDGKGETDAQVQDRIEEVNEQFEQRLSEIVAAEFASEQDRMIQLTRLGIHARQTKGVTPQTMADIDAAVQEASAANQRQRTGS